jgi:GTP-binding protein EngB required for normal cell division
MTDKRKILIIGITGGGKSALANLLINKEENLEEEGGFEEFFKESDSSTSETQKIQIREVEINEVKYQIIDTPGIGNTRLVDEEVAREIIFKACYECYKFGEGLNQIFFVIGGRFTQEEIKIYNIIKKKIFGEDINNYTTIVRTKFDNFRNEEKCKEDRKLLREENKKIRKMIESCNNVIHIDNPSLNSANEREIDVYKRRKKDSRNILLDNLTNYQNVYNSAENLKSINETFVESYVNKDRNSRDEFTRSLGREVEKQRSRGFIKKGLDGLSKLLGKKEQVIEKVIEAAIEIRNNCKQM